MMTLNSWPFSHSHSYRFSPWVSSKLFAGLGQTDQATQELASTFKRLSAMPATETDVTIARSVCPSVCPSSTFVKPAKAVWRNEMALGRDTRVGSSDIKAGAQVPGDRSFFFGGGSRHFTAVASIVGKAGIHVYSAHATTKVERNVLSSVDITQWQETRHKTRQVCLFGVY